ncbi:hypothetical protein ACFX2J_045079 [Malus domestica]
MTSRHVSRQPNPVNPRSATHVGPVSSHLPFLQATCLSGLFMFATRRHSTTLRGFFGIHISCLLSFGKKSICFQCSWENASGGVADARVDVLLLHGLRPLVQLRWIFSPFPSKIRTEKVRGSMGFVLLCSWKHGWNHHSM